MNPTSRPDRRRGERTAAQRERDRATRQSSRGSRAAPQQPRPQTSRPAARNQEGRGGSFLNSLIIALLVGLAVMVVILLVVFRGTL